LNNEAVNTVFTLLTRTVTSVKVPSLHANFHQLTITALLPIFRQLYEKRTCPARKSWQSLRRWLL